MRNRLPFLAIACLVLVGGCKSDRDPTSLLRPEPLQQDQAGSSATVSGFTYVVSTKLGDAPAVADPLLRPSITVSAKLRNDRSDSAMVTYGSCNVALDAYRSSDRRGAPVWRSWAAEPWEGTYGRGCTAIAIQNTLAPGDELTFAYSTRLIELLGDSLPNGTPDWRSTRAFSTVWRQAVLNRGQSTSLETTANSREILGNGLPEGLYHFAVVVHTRTRHVWLSAGSAELRR